QLVADSLARYPFLTPSLSTTSPATTNPGSTSPAPAASWQDYLRRPEVSLALMEFGRGLLQPRSVFQTAGGQIANSLRDAFSTVQEQKDRELKRKLSEREVGARERAAGATELGARAQ